MLKEKLYVEYQNRYKDYIAARENVDRLKSEAESIRREGVRERKNIERKRAEIERQLDSVKKDGAKSPVFQEQSKGKIREIKSIEERIDGLKKEKKTELKNLEAEKKEIIDDLALDKELCQKRLDDLMNGGDGGGFVKIFDENQLRTKLIREKEQEVGKLSARYDTAIAEAQDALQNIDSKYSGILQRELSYVENDEKLQFVYSGLSAKMSANELPAVISDSLAESVEGVITRQGLNDGQSVAKLSSLAGALDDLKQYTPKWLINLVICGFPAIAGVVMLLIFIFSGIRLSFVATAANVIVTFLFRILCAVLGFGIVYGILGAVARKKAGIIGGVLAGIIFFVISLNRTIMLPYGVTNAVEWLVKFIICLALGIGIFFLNSGTRVGDFLVSLGMKLGFIKKAALERQGYAIQENVDSYCALIRYREIIETIVEVHKQQQYSTIRNEMSRLKAERKTSVAELTGRMDQDIERTVARERADADASRKKYEQSQMNLIQKQDAAMLELSEYDGKIAAATDKLDKKIIAATENFDKKITDNQEKLRKLKGSITSDKDILIKQLEQDISDCDDEMRNSIEKYFNMAAEKEGESRELQEELAEEFDAIYKLFMKIYRAGSPELEETEGVVSDKFYIFDGKEVANLQEEIKKAPDRTGSLTPIRLYEIRHKKNPIVFLYDSMDSSKIATELHDFMDAINIGLYTINCNKIYELYITDPLSKGINFKDQEERGRLHIVDDIRELYEIISDSMNFVASKGHQLSIDDLNRKLIRDGNDEEDINKFGKYRVVQFIVPEEDSNQTTDFFTNDIWTKFETCKKHGFLPIFYIKRTDWDAALNNHEKFNSKFISKLNKALGSDKDQKNIYSINMQRIAIERYEG